MGKVQMTRFQLRLPYAMYQALKVESHSRKGEPSMNTIILEHIKEKYCRSCGENIAAYCDECMYETFKKGEEKCQKE